MGQTRVCSYRRHKKWRNNCYVRRENPELSDTSKKKAGSIRNQSVNVFVDFKLTVIYARRLRKFYVGMVLRIHA